MGLSPAVLLHSALLLGSFEFCCGGYVAPTKYLIVSNARNGTIGYVQLPRRGNFTEVRTLIDKDLIHPQGIAVDQKRQLLLIADSELKKVVSYGLMVHEDGSLGVDEQTPVAEDVETRWVAVDGPGNVYVTDETSGRILKISASQVLDGDTTAKPVYDGKKSDSEEGAIAAPGGIATDNFHLYWANKKEGQRVGTLVKALDAPPNSTGVPLKSTALAKNTPKAYGVCLALDHVYFTDLEHNVYAVKAAGGDVVKVSSQLANPRGCVWDGDSTIYVADRSAGGVFALAGPRVNLAEATATKAIHFEGAFGVAVFSSAFSGQRLSALWLAAVIPLAAAFALARPSC